MPSKKAFPSRPDPAGGQDDSFFVTLRTPEDSPLVAVALHHGHRVRPEVARHLAISEEQRNHDEDRFAGVWTLAAPVSVVVLRSRFEVDLDRPRARAAFPSARSAAGIRVWRQTPPADVLVRSAELHDAFYDYMAELLDSIVLRHGTVVVLDLHSYSPRLALLGAGGGQHKIPDIRLSTVGLRSRRWRGLVECFLETAGSTPVMGRRLAVREARGEEGHVEGGAGGYFARWVNQRYGERGCALSIGVKRFFVDESTGQLDPPKMRATSELLRGVNRQLAHALEAA